MLNMKNLRNKFSINSIVILNIQKGVTKVKIRTLFSRFGRITRMATKEDRNKKHMLMAFIKFSTFEEMKKSLSKKVLVLCRDIPLQIRKAFDDDNITIEFQPSSPEQQPSTTIDKNHRNKFAAKPKEGKFAGFKQNCKCHHCVKTREQILRKRLEELMMMMKKLHTHRKGEEFEKLSIKLLELQVDYTKLLHYYRHNI